MDPSRSSLSTLHSWTDIGSIYYVHVQSTIFICATQDEIGITLFLELDSLGPHKEWQHCRSTQLEN